MNNKSIESYDLWREQNPDASAYAAWQACAAEKDKEIERLKDAEESNKAVELALEDVPYKGSYADGIEQLKKQLAAMARYQNDRVITNEINIEEVDINDPRR